MSQPRWRMLLGRALGARALLLCASVALCALLPVLVGAQAVVGTNPLSVTVAATRGDVQERTILLDTSAPVTGLTVLISDLPRADNRAALPRSAVQVLSSTATITPGEHLSLPLRFDLAGAESGDYAGSLLVSYTSAGAPSTLTIPLRITVKDAPYVPLLLLIAGVVLASAISYYRSSVQPRDQAFIRSDGLRNQFGGLSGTAEAGSFVRAANLRLAQADRAIRNGKLEEAAPLLDDADNLLKKWLDNADDWTALVGRTTQIESGLAAQGVDDGLAFAPAFKKRLADLRVSAASYDSPASYESAINDGAIAPLNAFVAQRAKVAPLATLVEQAQTKLKLLSAPGDLSLNVQDYAAKVAAVQARLAKVTPDQPDAAIGDDADALFAAGQTLLPQIDPPRSANLNDLALDPDAARRAAMEKVQKISPTLYDMLSGAPAAAARTTDLRSEGGRAERRQLAYNIARVGIAILFLAGAGFNELYVKNAFFGADRFADYLALLIWGFSAETSRAAITDLANRLGVSTGPSGGT